MCEKPTIPVLSLLIRMLKFCDGCIVFPAAGYQNQTRRKIRHCIHRRAEKITEQLCNLTKDKQSIARQPIVGLINN